jgi:predicted DNA-binding protein (MmcQ/YjbR family)
LLEFSNLDFGMVEFEIPSLEISPMASPEALHKKLREICLPLPEVAETVKWGHTVFVAGKKMFAVIGGHNDQPTIGFKTTFAKQAELVNRREFYPSPYAAKHGWVTMDASGKVDWEEVAGFLKESYRLVALKRMLKSLDGTETRESAGASGPTAGPKAQRPSKGR